MKSELQKLLENAGYKTKSYCQQEMYNKPYLCVVCENVNELFADIIEAILGVSYYSTMNNNDISYAIRSMKTISRRNDVIVYFPGVEYSFEVDIKPIVDYNHKTE